MIIALETLWQVYNVALHCYCYKYYMVLHSHYILLMSLNPCDVRVSECVACVMFKFVSVLQVHV